MQNEIRHKDSEKIKMAAKMGGKTRNLLYLVPQTDSTVILMSRNRLSICRFKDLIHSFYIDYLMFILKKIKMAAKMAALTQSNIYFLLEICTGVRADVLMNYSII